MINSYEVRPTEPQYSFRYCLFMQNSRLFAQSVLPQITFKCLIYVNDIAESLTSVTRLFADDRSLAVSSRDKNHIEITINRDLEIISAWAKQWLIQFNAAKTEVMYFSLSKNNRDAPDIYFQNTHLNFVHSHKHLGVTLSDGTWHQHISNITTSSSRILGTMRMLKFKLKRKTLNQIYISYLRPIIEYASLVWDSCTLYEQNVLESIQYDAARIVTGLTRSVSIVNLIREIGWVSLADRRKMQKLILVFKHSRGELPCYLSDIFPEIVGNNSTYNLRNNENYATVARRLEIYSKSVIPSSIKVWNSLDLDTRNSHFQHSKPDLKLFFLGLKLRHTFLQVTGFFKLPHKN